MRKLVVFFLIFLFACSKGISSLELIAINHIKENPEDKLFMLESRVYVQTGDELKEDQENHEKNR